MQQSKILSLKLSTVLIHPSLNIEPPYTKHPISFAVLYQIENPFVTLEALGEELQMFTEVQSRGTMCEDSTFFEFLSVSVHWSIYPIGFYF
jgi:hypothetical protein